MKTNNEDILVCIFCGSDMDKSIETDVVCYKCTNKKCIYSFCERL